MCVFLHFFSVVKIVNPTLYVTTPSQEELIEMSSATFACLAKGFSPRTHKLKWYLGQKEVTENVTSLPEVKDNGNSLFSVSSFLSLTEKQWKSEDARVTCIFEGKPGSSVVESVSYHRPGTFRSKCLYLHWNCFKSFHLFCKPLNNKLKYMFDLCSEEKRGYSYVNVQKYTFYIMCIHRSVENQPVFT